MNIRITIFFDRLFKFIKELPCRIWEEISEFFKSVSDEFERWLYK